MVKLEFGQANQIGQVKCRDGIFRDVLHLDMETFYGTKYSLTGMTYADYYRDERFKFHGVGIAVNHGEAEYYTTEHVHEAFEGLDIENMVLAGQNLMFDASLLLWAFGRMAFEYHDIKNFGRAYWPGQGATLDAMTKRAWPDDPSKWKGKELADFKNQRDLNERQQMVMGGYCKNDVNVTRNLYYEVLLHNMPMEEIMIQHETLMLYLAPKFVADTDLIREALDEAEQETKAKIKASGVNKTTLSSNPKFVALLESYGLKVPTKISPTTGKETYALGQKDPAFIKLMANNPQYKAIWDARQAVKSTLTATRAQRMLDLAEASGGMMPVPLNYYGAHCVPGDTEVLTRDGWRRIDEWEGGDIMQVDERQKMTFAHADRFVGPETDQWVRSDAPYAPGLFTLGHKIPYLTHGSFQWRQGQAGTLSERGSFYLPTSGQLCDDAPGGLTAEAMRVVAMVQADGHFTENQQLQIFLGKPRKIERARQLLHAAGLPFRELTFDSHPSMVRFVIAGADQPGWLRTAKHFGPWLLGSTADAREAFIQELVHWDGWTNNGCQVAYGTTVRENADWVATLCHLTDRSASIHEKPQRGNRQMMYEVIIRERNYTMVKREHWSQDGERRRTYCTETQTGFWLARHDGRIFVTGNTGRWSGAEKVNLQNLTRGGKLRLSLKAPPGKKVYVADSSNIEARMISWLANEQEALEMFRNGQDTYNDMASKIYGYDVRRKEVDDAGNKVFEEEGNVGKTARLGLGFGMGHVKFQHTLASGPMGSPPIYKDNTFCQMAVDTFRRDNPMIVEYWQVLKQVIYDMMLPGTDYQMGPIRVLHEQLVMPNGLALKYPNIRYHTTYNDDGSVKDRNLVCDRKDGASHQRLYGGILSENITQALARTVVAQQALVALETLPECELALLVHDEIVMIGPDDEHNETRMETLLNVMRQPPEWCPDLPLDSEGGFAAEYSK